VTTGGWVMMLATFGVVIAVNVFCLVRLLKR
jgi:hypothetical protein